MRRRLGRRPHAAAAAASIALLAAACGGSAPAATPKPLPTAPEPAASPATTVAPAGQLVGVGNQPEGIAIDPVTGIIAVAVRQPDQVVFLSTATGAVREQIPLAGAARHLEMAGPGGPLIVPEETTNEVDELALPRGNALFSVQVGQQPHDAAALHGNLAVADEFGNTIHLIDDGQVVGVRPAPLQPGGVAAGDGVFVVVGVRARLIEAYSPIGTELSTAPAGAGPTHVRAGQGGYFYVADTNGGAILAYHLSGTKLSQVATFPVGPQPYGLAYDSSNGWLYVTLTGANQLVGLHLDGAKVVSRRTWATGQQPNSVAVDDSTGLIAVTDTAIGQVQLITP